MAMLSENAIDATVCKMTRTTQELTRGTSLERREDIESQPMTLQHVAHKNPCGLALNYTNILDDPLNEGATDRITKN